MAQLALFLKNRRYVLIRLDLSDDDLEQIAEADRREVDPPIQVETAMWSKAGQLDWWVKERQEWWVAYVVRMDVNGGSKLLIFVPRAARTSLEDPEACC